MRFSLPRKSIYILLIGFILFLPGMQTIAQSVHDIVLTDGQEVYPLGLHLEILEDKEKEWTIDDVISPEISAKFEPARKKRLVLVLRIQRIGYAFRCEMKQMRMWTG